SLPAFTPVSRGCALAASGLRQRYHTSHGAVGAVKKRRGWTRTGRGQSRRRDPGRTSTHFHSAHSPDTNSIFLGRHDMQSCIVWLSVATTGRDRRSTRLWDGKTAVNRTGRRFGPRLLLLAFALALSACAGANRNREVRDPRPENYKSDILAMLPVYLR